MSSPIIDLGVTRDGIVSRRGFLKYVGYSAGVVAGAAQIGWRDMVIAQADQLRKRGKSMILLWMDGAPSQFESFNPKPGSENQGPAQAISTRLPGVQFAEHWPKTAAVADKIALIRSMKTGEADHARAIKLVRTGYAPSPAVRYPTFGAVVAKHREDVEFELPAFVRVGKPRIATRDVDQGVMGIKYASFKIDVPGKLPPDVRTTVSPEVLARRMALSEQFDAEFAVRGADDAVLEKRDIYRRTSRFVLSPRLNTFSLDAEPEKLRDAYGRTSFGQGCLLARRLVEQGVSFVEVFGHGSLNDQGWDTHKNGFKENPLLAGETDPGYATLLTDLADRGMLEDTLVVWMGEFGRTPKFKPDGGRDHYAEGWQVGLSGGGVRMGQVIGATDKDGVKVTDRPIGVQDLFFTFCTILGLDPREEYNTPDGRPIKIVDGGKLIEELI